MSRVYTGVNFLNNTFYVQYPYIGKNYERKAKPSVKYKNLGNHADYRDLRHFMYPIVFDLTRKETEFHFKTVKLNSVFFSSHAGQLLFPAVVSSSIIISIC